MSPFLKCPCESRINEVCRRIGEETHLTSAHSTSYFGDPPRGPLTPVYLSRLRMHAYTVICLIGSIRADTAAAVALADRWTRDADDEDGSGYVGGKSNFNFQFPATRKKKKKKKTTATTTMGGGSLERPPLGAILARFPPSFLPCQRSHSLLDLSTMGRHAQGDSFSLLSQTFICCCRCSVRPGRVGT